MGIIIETIIAFWPLILLAVLIKLYDIFKPTIKGFLGEKELSAILSLSLNKSEYTILNDIMLQTENGTTQIDHIVLSKTGVFIIETKNYTGKIYGKESDEYWTRAMYRTKNKFRNPIKQNYGHVVAVEKLIAPIKEITPIPIVAFSNNCDLKVKTYSKVNYFTAAPKIIKTFKEEVLTKEEIEKIIEIINVSNITDKEAKKKHVDDIKDNIAQKEYEMKNNICPKCKGNLIERQSKNGYKFIGCSNYPSCTYTKKR